MNEKWQMRKSCLSFLRNVWLTHFLETFFDPKTHYLINKLIVCTGMFYKYTGLKFFTGVRALLRATGTGTGTGPTLGYLQYMYSLQYNV